MYNQISINIPEIKAIIDELHKNKKERFLTTDIIRGYKTNLFKETKKFSGWSVYALWSIVLMDHHEELGICHSKVGVPVLNESGRQSSCSEWEIIC